MKKILSLFALLLPLLGSARHPIHLSITTVAHNSETHSLEITHKFFVDDFERRVEKDCGLKLQLGTPQQHAQAQASVEAFMRKNFSLSLHGKPVAFSFVGFEVDAESILIYVEAKGVKKLKQVDVSLTVLLDVFEDQRNVVNFMYQGQKKTAIIEGKSPRQTIEF